MAFYIFLGFTILWFLFMTYLSHQDGEHTGKTSWELAKKLSFLDSDINILNGRLRRLAHVVLYAVLAVLLGITLELGGYSPWLMVGTIIWAWADEATKPLVRGRHFSWFDVGLNVLGIAIGIVIERLLYLH